MPTTINRADWVNGSNWVLAGTISDDSFGSRTFRLNVKLGSPEFFPDGLLHDAQGDYAVFRITLKDAAGNQRLIAITVRITATAPLLPGPGTAKQPNIIPSDTLLAILDTVVKK